MSGATEETSLHGAIPFFERYPDAALAPLKCGYTRREPEKTLLYEIVAENLEALLAAAREANPDGEALPRFVEREFRAYLTCGLLSYGFSRVVCTRCGHEMVVGFSCKGRGFCPSCTTRRMHDTAAHLVDRVLPEVPYRQWVLSFPHELRLRLGYERESFTAARRIVLASIFAWQRRQAREDGIGKPLVGAISFAQRFASNLALFPHLHLIVPDGVFFENEAGGVEFRVLSRPTLPDLERVAARIARRVARWLDQHQGADEPTDALAATYASAAESRRRGEPAESTARPSRLVARVDGYSLEAGRHAHAHDRAGLERLCKYGSRPPISLARLKRTDDGGLVLGFKRPMADGSTGVHLTPMELLRRLAALVPPPGFHLVGYHGVFAAHSTHRPLIVPQPPTEAAEPPDALIDGFSVGPPQADEDPELRSSFTLASNPRERYLPWSELMKRTRAVDVLRCERCGARMRLMAAVLDPTLAREILAKIEARAPTQAPS